MRPCPSVTTALADLAKNGNKPDLLVQFPDNVTITTPGEKLSSASTKPAPTQISIATSLVKPDTKYTVACLDLDAPFPSFSFLGPIAHYIHFDFVAGEAAEEGFSKLESSSPALVNYIGPGPPPPSAAHRYVFLAWEQPEAVTTQSAEETMGLKGNQGVSARMRWDQVAFEQKMGLAKPIAVNYFNADSR